MVDNKFFWIGGALWLDWVNTQAVSGGVATELVNDFADLAAWLQLAAVTSSENRRVMGDWSDEQEATVLQAAHDLRAHLRNLCEAIKKEGKAPDEAIEVLNAHLARRALVSQLRRTESGVQAVESLEMSEELGVLFPIAQSAAQWLVAAEWSLLKKCANPKCILWFYDTSKNHSRRWCSMEGCGNRHKVTAHLRKKRAIM